MKSQVADAIERHRRAGSEFEAGGIRSFVREEGGGDPVVLMHGVPVSSFLYRKVLPLLAQRSLSVLDTLIDVAHFRRVWTMDLAAPPVIGPLWVASIRPPVARWLFYMQGIGDRSATPAHEVDAHFALLHRDGGGRTFRKIVRGFELTAEKERLYTEGLSDVGWPATILWGDRDPALGDGRRRAIEDAVGLEAKVISAKHFLQEDRAPAVADAIARLAGSA
jgi:haloalkane dehalogenase